jgi:hypothetical protein
MFLVAAWAMLAFNFVFGKKSEFFVQLTEFHCTVEDAGQLTKFFL